ncbi:hypothetical protein HMPREF1869_00264 [Bacteroidales bacterium KA00251]|nr:hypothetical protein HMPREF1869_00264 [Bacteroidales bacterium KA00251]
MKTKVSTIFLPLIALVLSLGAYCEGFAQEAKSGAKIETTEVEFDFGEILEADGPVSHTFVVKNTGKSPLVLTRVSASCGCTKPEFSREPIAPGASTKIKITYNPAGRPGQFVKTIAIYSNGSEGAVTVRIRGVVK